MDYPFHGKIFRSADGKWHARLVGRNGRILFSTEANGYNRRGTAEARLRDMGLVHYRAKSDSWHNQPELPGTPRVHVRQLRERIRRTLRGATKP